MMLLLFIGKIRDCRDLRDVKRYRIFQNSADDNGLAVSKSIKVIKCNGLKTKPFGRDAEAEYVSQVVVIGTCTR